MKKNALVRLALRDGWGSRRILWWPALCLMLATFCFHTLHHLSLEVQQTVLSQTQELSGGDLTFAMPYPLTTAQQEKIHSAIKQENLRIEGEAQTIEFLSMLRPTSAEQTFGVPLHARLVEVHAVSKNFPLYGVFTTKKIAEPNTKSTAPVISMAPELRSLFGSRTVRLGNSDFQMVEDVTAEPGGSLSPFPIAPHVFITVDDVATTGLLQTGSRIKYHSLFKLDQIPKPEFVKSLRTDLGDERIQIHTAVTSSTQIEKLFDRVFRFARLSSLLAMTLALSACAVGLRLVQSEQIRTRMTLHTLGLTLAEVRYWSLIQTAGLVLCSCAMGWLFSTVSEPYFAQALVSQFQIQINFIDHPLAELKLAIYFLVLIASILILQRSQLTLLRVSAAVVTLVFTILLIEDWKWGAGFWLSVIIVTFLFRVMILGLLKLLDRFLIKSNWSEFRITGPLRVRLLSLVRYPSQVSQGMSGIGLGLFLVFGLLIFRDSLMAELQSGRVDHPPELFLIDVGTDQKDQLQAVLEKQHVGSQWSRFVKARMLTVNGTSPAEVPEEERLHREFNLNDRETLDPTEKLVEGHWWSGKATENATVLEASVEVEFASRMHLKLGDRVSFDLQGVTFETAVTSLRKVDWTSFHPNFFFLIQPGFLDNAPQTWIASLSPSHLPGTLSNLELQDQLVEAAPNVTVIDLVQTLKRVTHLIESIEKVITFLATLIITAGLLLLVSSLMELSRLRENETALLRALGANQTAMTRSNFLESLTWAGLILVLGIPTAGLTLVILISQVFQGEAKLGTLGQWGMIIGFTIAVVGITLVVQRRSRNEAPSQLLRS